MEKEKVKTTEKEQIRLRKLVEELRLDLEKHAIDRQDKLEWYIEDMKRKAANLPYLTISFIYKILVGGIFSGAMRVKTVEFHKTAIEKALKGFDPKLISGLTVEELMDEPGIIKHKGKLRGCISGAKFLLEIEQEFGSFYSFLRQFGILDKPPIIRWSLVCLLADRISGVGTAIACDFLKGIGLTAFAKPDVHVKRTLFRHGITLKENEDDFICFKEIDKLAKASGLEPAHIDRIMWLRGQKFQRW